MTWGTNVSGSLSSDTVRAAKAPEPGCDLWVRQVCVCVCNGWKPLTTAPRQFPRSRFPVQRQRGCERGHLEVGIANQTCGVWAYRNLHSNFPPHTYSYGKDDDAVEGGRGLVGASTMPRATTRGVSKSRLRCSYPGAAGLQTSGVRREASRSQRSRQGRNRGNYRCREQKCGS
jgi:hypothetical protein